MGFVLPGGVEAGDGEPWSVQHLQDETGTALLQPPRLQPQAEEEFIFINTHMLRSGPTERNFSSAETRAGPVTHKSLRKEFIPPPEQNTRKQNATQMLKLFGFYVWGCQDFAIILAGLLHWELGHSVGCPQELQHPRAWAP